MFPSPALLVCFFIGKVNEMFQVPILPAAEAGPADGAAGMPLRHQH